MKVQLNETDVVSFKTHAWTSPEMVKNYAATMHRTSRTNGIKNRIELELVRRGVAGNEILDIGVGTGRAAIPLAQAGYAVTGLDVSAAMLAQTQREAANLNLPLVQGDVAALPFADASFDSVVSLNCLMHFPNWKTILIEWARVVRPGGRLIFDLHSLDHVEAVAAAFGCSVETLLGSELTDPSRFVARVTSQELVDAATELGLSVEGLTPYAAILGGGNQNCWFWRSVASGPFYERLLSWIGAEDDLGELAYLIEETIGILDTRATGRFMAVLVKDGDGRRTERRAARIRALSQGWATADLVGLAAAASLDLEALRANLATHLSRPKSRTFLTIIAAAIPSECWVRIAAELVPVDARTEFDRVRRGFRFDRLAADFLHNVNANTIAPTAATYRGVDLTSIMRYGIGRRLVATLWRQGEQ